MAHRPARLFTRFLIASVACYVLWNVLVYASCAFVLWNVDITTWIAPMRGMFATVGLFLGLAVAAILGVLITLE